MQAPAVYCQQPSGQLGTANIIPERSNLELTRQKIAEFTDCYTN